MSITSISSSYLFAPFATSRASSGTSNPTSNKHTSATEFLNYMKMTPAQQMEYTWLSQHGITKEKFDAMSPEDKQKLLAKMKQEIEDKIKHEAERSTAKGTTGTITNIVA